MDYTKTNWQEGKAGGTPMNPAALNNMEDGIDAAQNQDGTTTVTPGATCTFTYDAKTAMYYLTPNQDWAFAVASLPTTGRWAMVCELDNSGGYAGSYPVAWRQAGSDALSFTTGVNQVLIRGVGNDESTIVISITEDDLQ